MKGIMPKLEELRGCLFGLLASAFGSQKAPKCFWLSEAKNQKS
jgi:hypothetical protein